MCYLYQNSSMKNPNDYIKQKDSAFRQFYGNFYPQKITILTTAKDHLPTKTMTTNKFKYYKKN